MGKALVINGADFSENKLTTVTLMEDVPCTGITISETELSLANIGTTHNLTATVTPLNTTDAVIWESSNGRIASVSQNGTVTVTGAGTATITVKCGTKSASCTLTTTHTLSMVKAINGVINGKGSEAGAANSVIRFTADTGGHYACAYQDTPLIKHMYSAADKYPIYFGHANTLTITAPSNIRVTAVVTDSTRSPEESDNPESTCAMWLKKDSSQFDSTVPLGNRVITDIPDAADSVGLCFQKPDTSGGNISDADIASITVVAS